MSGGDRNGTLRYVRAAAAIIVIVSIFGAFVYELAKGDDIQPWMVLLVSVLGLGAGAHVLGTEAIRTGYDVFRGDGGER